MKKAVALVLCAVMLLSLCACGKSKAVKSVETSIASIGEVTLDSETQITDARKAYDALSKEEKDSVENYSTLKEAEAQLKKIKPIKLTTENIQDYLKIEVSSNDYKTDREFDSFFHVYWDYSGSGTATISTINQTNSHFENVSIKLRVSMSIHSTWDEEANQYDCNSGWEFDTGNVQDEDYWSNGTVHGWRNYKDFKITLPYDGNWTISESMHYKTYKWTSYTPNLEPRFKIDVLEVSGTVVLPEGYTTSE